MAGLFRVVRPCEQQLHQLNQVPVSCDVPGILRPDGENTLFADRFCQKAEANAPLVFTLCTKECIAHPHGTYGLQTGEDVANVLTDVAHKAGSAVIFYPAEDRDAQLSRLPLPLQTAMTTRTGYARVGSDHQTRLDFLLVFKLPESYTLPPSYQLCKRDLGTFTIVPPMIPPGTGTFLFPAHRPHSPVAVDAGITGLPWQYAGLVVRAGTLRAKGPSGNEHTFMLARMLEKYASTLSVGYWAALDHAYTLSDEGYPWLQHLLPGERQRIRYWLQSLAHDCDDGDVNALQELDSHLAN